MCFSEETHLLGLRGRLDSFGQKLFQILKVFRKSRAQIPLMQYRGRVEDGENQEVPHLKMLTAHFGDRHFLVQKRLGRKIAQGANHAGLDHLDLFPEIRQTGIDLVRLGVSVLRRAAFDHIGDIDVFALQADAAQEIRKQFPGRANEGPVLKVFILAGRLADEHDLGIGVAFAEHDMCARLAQPTFTAVFNLFVELLERNHCAP